MTESCDVHEANTTEQCLFVQSHGHCTDDEQFISYIQFIYCSFGSGNVVPGCLILALWLLVMFLGLGTTADDFLTPALIVISKTLRLSQNIAGVTFLAFGNGAPDIISSLAGISQSRPELVIGELFGAGIFVTCVVAGSICLTQNFKIMERPFLRDIIFYIGATYWAFYMFYTEQITLYHSIGFIVLYCAYIVVVLISRVVYQKYKDAPQPNGTTGPQAQVNGGVTENGSIQNSLAPPPKPELKFDGKRPDDPEAEGVVLRRFSFRHSIVGIPRKRTLSGVHLHHHHENSIYIITGSTEYDKASLGGSSSRSSSFRQNGGIPPLINQQSTTSMSALIGNVPSGQEMTPIVLTPLMEFLYHICPLDIDEWPNRKWFGKILDICKAPIYFLLTITTPVVDYENDKDNWCRILNTLHCIISPLFITSILNYTQYMIADVVPFGVVVLGVCIILALAVFFTSKYEEPPKYHWAFGYLGFFVSVFWIYGMANEVVSLLKAVGIVFRVSDATLGMTVLAWGNSIGDFISNLSVARQGYPRMAISACFGGPLLNLLLGIGIPYTIELIQEGTNLSLSWSTSIGILYGTICHSLVSTLVVMTILKFNVKRLYGAYLVAVYALFFIAAILVEVKVF